jgi:hypothetical protein
MKKFLLCLLLGSLSILYFSNSSFGSLVWQVGERDGAVSSIIGASEYSQTGTLYQSFTFNPDTDNYENMPGYLGTSLVSQFDTTETLIINFFLSTDYNDLKLTYGRYGSEDDKIYSSLYMNNPDFLLAEGPGENLYQEYVFDFGSAGQGQHEVKIEYANGGSDGGHFIDYVQLEGTSVPIPGAVWLLGSGLIGLVGLRRLKK